MPGSTRRHFLTTAGAGAAVVGAATVLPATSADAAEPVGADAPTRLIAYVDDARTGLITLMVDEREVEIHDHDLVARLRKAAR